MTRPPLKPLPSLIAPLEGLHSQLTKYRTYPEGRELPFQHPHDRLLAEQHCETYTETVLYRLGFIRLSREEHREHGRAALRTEVYLTPKGHTLLNALNGGEVWNVSASAVNPVQTKYHWLKIIRDNVGLPDNILQTINGLPDNGNYAEVKGALTYWLLTATPHTRVNGNKAWFQLGDDGVIDHKLPGKI